MAGDAFNRMCVAGWAALCNIAGMSAIFRSFLAMLMIVTLLGVTAYTSSAAVAAEIAAASDPCCDDCPDNPACGASCVMMVRCGTVIGALTHAETVVLSSVFSLTALSFEDLALTAGQVPDGLRRPPRI